jgi:hypothetical protein
VTAQPTTTTTHVTLPETRAVDVTITDTGGGRPILLSHGGGGPLTVGGFAAQFAADETNNARVITPTHPGVQPHAATRRTSRHQRARCALRRSARPAGAHRVQRSPIRTSWRGHGGCPSDSASAME